MSKEVKPGLFRLEWSEDQEESIYSLTNEEIDKLEQEVLRSGLGILLPSMPGVDESTAERIVQSKDD